MIMEMLKGEEGNLLRKELETEKKLLKKFGKKNTKKF